MQLEGVRQSLKNKQVSVRKNVMLLMGDSMTRVLLLFSLVAILPAAAVADPDDLKQAIRKNGGHKN